VVFVDIDGVLAPISRWDRLNQMQTNIREQRVNTEADTDWRTAAAREISSQLRREISRPDSLLVP
jgi:FMN phosphatase YigB (HAD superfamily)